MITQIKPLIKKKVKLPITKNLVILFLDIFLINLFFNELVMVLKIYQYNLNLLCRFPQVYLPQ